MNKDKLSVVVAGGFFALFGLALVCVGLFGREESPLVPVLFGLGSTALGVLILRSVFKPAPAAGAAGGPLADIFEIPQLTQAIGTQLIHEAPPTWTSFKISVRPDPQSGYLCCIEGPGGQTFRPSMKAQQLVAQFAARTKRSGRFTSMASKKPNGEWAVSVEPN